MTVEKLMEMVKNGEVKESHTSMKRGYISRKLEGKVYDYSGRFGKGYTLETPRLDTTQYVNVTYYINK